MAIPDPLAALAIHAYKEYKSTGSRDAVEMAVKFGKESVRKVQKEDKFAGCLNNLGVMLESGYERTGEMADLEAITSARQAVDSTPKDHSDRAGRLNSLGNKLGHMFVWEEKDGRAGQTPPQTTNDDRRKLKVLLVVMPRLHEERGEHVAGDNFRPRTA